MIRSGMSFTLRPYKTYREDHSKDVPVGYGEDSRGKFLKFQIMDVNRAERKGSITGFSYVNVYTDIALRVGDFITIEDILYVQVKSRIVVLGITIKQKNPSTFGEIETFGEEIDF